MKWKSRVQNENCVIMILGKEELGFGFLLAYRVKRRELLFNVQIVFESVFEFDRWVDHIFKILATIFACNVVM